MDSNKKELARRAAKVLLTKEKPLPVISNSLFDSDICSLQPRFNQAEPKKQKESGSEEKVTLTAEGEEALDYIQQLESDLPPEKRSLLLSCLRHLVTYLSTQNQALSQAKVALESKVASFPLKLAEQEEILRRQTAGELSSLKSKISELTTEVREWKSEAKESKERILSIQKEAESKELLIRKNEGEKFQRRIEEIAKSASEKEKVTIKEWTSKVELLEKEIRDIKMQNEIHLSTINEESKLQMAEIRLKLAEKHKLEIEKALEAVDKQHEASTSLVVSKLENKLKLLVSENEELTFEVTRVKEILLKEQQSCSKKMALAEEAEHRMLLATQRLEADRALFEREKEKMVHIEVDKRVEELRFGLDHQKGKEIEFIVEKLALEKDAILEACRQEVESVKKEAAKTKIILEAENSRLRNSLKTVQDELNQSKEAHLQTIRDLETQNKSLKTDILTRLQKELTLKSEVISSQNARVVSLNEKLAFYEKQSQEKTEEIASMKSQLKKMSADIHKKETEIEREVIEVEERCRAILGNKEGLIRQLKDEVVRLRSIIESDLKT